MTKLDSSHCFPKNSSNIMRKVFVQNITTDINRSSINYDMIYISLASALEAETKFLSQHVFSILELFLEEGNHSISENEFFNSEEEFFRLVYANITISGNSNSMTKVFVKTNSFYLFASNLLISNLIFIGNDINMNNNEKSWNNIDYPFCTDSDIENDYLNVSNMKISCSIKNRPLAKFQKSQNYGFFNLEMISDNIFGVTAKFTIQNCRFENFEVLNSTAGFSSLISLAPLAGNFLVENVVLNNAFFFKGIVYYSIYDFDPFYSDLFLQDKTLTENYSSSVGFRNVSVFAYNRFYLQANELDLYMFFFTEFSGNLSIQNCFFEQINNLLNIFAIQNDEFSNDNIFEIRETTFSNISQTSFLTVNYIPSVFIRNSIFDEVSSGEFFFISVENSNNFSIICSKFKSFRGSADFFQTKNSFFNIINSFLDQGVINSLIKQDKNVLLVSNSSISNIFFNQYLIFFNDFDGIFVNNSIFSNIQGIIYIFMIYNANSLVLSNSVLNNITIYAIFYVEETNLNLLQNILIKSSYFGYIWEKDITCKFVITNFSEIYHNIISISFYRDLSIPNILFLLRGVHIFENNFTQLSSGGMIQMQTGDCTFENSVFIDNYFLNYEKFQFLFEFDIDCHMIVRGCFYKDNGIITKKNKYPAFHYNDVFSLWEVIYTHFNNTIFMVTDKVEMLAGFISSSPHGGTFELMNSILIFEITNTIFEYKGIQLDHFLSATFINNTFYNLKCNYRSFANQYGGVSLLASTTYTFSKGQNEYWVYMKNNTFCNSSCINGGGLSIVAIKNIQVIDCKFINSKSENKGGAMILIGSENCFLKNILVNGSKSLQAGGLYTQNIFNLTLENLGILNASSLDSSIFYIKNIQNLKAYNFTSRGTFAARKAGIFMVYRSNIYLNFLKIIDTFAGDEAGAFFCDDRSEVWISNIEITNSSSKMAGVFSILSSIHFFLANAIIQHSFSIEDAGVFLMKGFTVSQLINVRIRSSGSVNGLGVIFIKNDDAQSALNINNLDCLGLFALDGACILFSSSSQVSLSNLNVESSNNGPIKLIGLNQIAVRIENITIIGCSSKTFIFETSNIDINIFQILLVNNTSENDVFTGYLVNGFISNGFFFNNTKK